jgi:hypothetical protein
VGGSGVAVAAIVAVAGGRVAVDSGFDAGVVDDGALSVSPLQAIARAARRQIGSMNSFDIVLRT